VLVLGRVTHPGFAVEPIAASPSDPLTADETGFDEVGDDSLHGSLRDPDHLGNVPQARVRVTRDAEKHLGVVGNETPGLRVLLG